MAHCKYNKTENPSSLNARAVQECNDENEENLLKSQKNSKIQIIYEHFKYFMDSKDNMKSSNIL